MRAAGLTPRQIHLYRAEAALDDAPPLKFLR